MTVKEASSAETPFGRYITSEGWFVLNLGDALAVRNEEKGGASYPIESQEHPFEKLGVHLRVLWPGDPNALYHSESAQEGFLVLSGECTLIVEDEERGLRQWDYFHVPDEATRTGPAIISRPSCHGRSSREELITTSAPSVAWTFVITPATRTRTLRLEADAGDQLGNQPQLTNTIVLKS